MMLGARTNMGSVLSTQELGQSGFLNVQLQLEQTGAGLYTHRVYKSLPTAIFLAFLGSVAGIIGSTVAVMRFVEKSRKKVKLKMKEQAAIIPSNTLLKEYYEVELDSKNSKYTYKDWIQAPGSAQKSTQESKINTMELDEPREDNSLLSSDGSIPNEKI